jgi:hypothetical protein
MKSRFRVLCIVFVSALHSLGGVAVDEEIFGNSLGGWTKRNKAAAEYPLSGSVYRTYKPEISKTPDGGLFISLRIDHVRGWLSSDDHAVLEVTVNAKGQIVSAQSNIAIQGRSIASEVILGTSDAGKALLGADKSVQIGTDLIADLSAKLLRENIVEAGRVSFPAALRHNYNHLFQSIRVKEGETPAVAPPPEPTPPPAPPSAPEPPEKDEDQSKPPQLDIKPYG